MASDMGDLKVTIVFRYGDVVLESSDIDYKYINQMIEQSRDVAKLAKVVAQLQPKPLMPTRYGSGPISSIQDNRS